MEASTITLIAFVGLSFELWTSDEQSHDLDLAVDRALNSRQGNRLLEFAARAYAINEMARSRGA